MRRLPFSLFALMLPLLSACEQGITEPDPALFGTYTLESMDGQPLPFLTVDNDTLSSMRISGDGSLRPDRTCEWNYTFRATDKRTGKVKEGVAMNPCTYEVRGNTLVLRTASGSKVDAKLARDGSIVTMHDQWREVWRK